MNAKTKKQLPDLDDATARAKEVTAQLDAAFPERTSLVRGAMTALLSSEHCLMLGPPGTAKSLFARTFANAVADGSYFEILLTKFTTVEEVFGPVSFSALKNDRFERMLDGYAATSRVIFDDEIFKASSAILNTKLTLMNERKFHNGGQLIDCPLEIMLSASNEYPQDDSLQALFDRFSFKFWVDYISDRDSLAKLLGAGGTTPVTAKLEPGDLDVLRDAVDSMPFKNGDIDTLLNIKAAVEDEGFVASDRTWVKAVRTIKARAVLAGRSNVVSNDFMVLADVLWKEHKERERLSTIIGNAADPYGARAEAIIDAVKTAMRELPDISLLKSGQMTKVEMIKKISDVSSNVASRRDALLDVIDEAGDENPAIAEANETVNAAIANVDEMMSTVTFFRQKK
jgi:MoxR-like ATPase